MYPLKEPVSHNDYMRVTSIIVEICEENVSQNVILMSMN